jgi:hypothetical protein
MTHSSPSATAAPPVDPPTPAHAATVDPPMPAHGPTGGTGHQAAPTPAPRERSGVSGSQVAASVLASTSAAVVASYFGVAGTIVGAAVVSVVATVGTAAYGLGIRRTSERLQQVQALRLGRAVTDVGDTRRPTAGGATAATPAADPSPASDDRTTSLGSPSPDRGDPSWPARLARHRFRLAAGVAVVLGATLAAVTLIEVVTDGPLSGGSGSERTSIGALFETGPTTGDGPGDGRGGTADDGVTTTTVTGDGTDAPAPATEPDAGRPPATSGTGATTTTTGAASSTTTSTTVPSPTTTTATPPTTAPPGAAAPSAPG